MAHVAKQTKQRPPRPLLPAYSPSPPGNSAGVMESSQLALNRPEPVRTACNTCRKRKIKCSGHRPVCNSCAKNVHDCVYATANADETSHQALKRKYDTLAEDSQVYQTLYQLLRNASEAEAQHILFRIRMGTDAKSLVSQIKEGDLLLQLASVPETRRRHSFPHIPAIPPSLPAPDNPYLDSVV
ncbi:hypothetical protein BKA67DRAFT_250725 [Truncatella angustata]|uniref:Zn(2)-C6 fungal-type domain-containing protein n=1 Tax=Truncatella angustata TaxID=152316 RepID=A0A9P9A081_9PEZI|nr:uncharacterized protein BKA67DRAFT_250725 [Truncatella angustata]KAH6655840.1 hypothetical protein BKA67DRAFT_250725 [Truncatella angustata]